MHEEIFETDSQSLIRDMHDYSYEPCVTDQETINEYTEKYKGWMMIASEAVVLEELLKKRKGEDIIKKDTELSKADNRGKTFRRELDETILYFGWS